MPPVIIKVAPTTPRPDGTLAIDSIWNYGKQDRHADDEAFVWFTNEHRTGGLAMRGYLQRIAPAGLSGNNHQQISLGMNVTRQLSEHPLTIDHLRLHQGSRLPGPLPKLADKLLGNALQKVVSLDGDEREYLDSLFPASTDGLSRAAWHDMERDAALAARSRISRRFRHDIERDLAATAMEGLTQEQQQIVRSRAVWLAARFARDRELAGNLCCDHCGFDPALRTQGTRINPRSLMDVHHRDPLAEGVRMTALGDFELLCPNCHRFAHASMRTSVVPT